MAEDQIGPSLDELTATITEQNKALKNMESLGKLDTTIKAMEKSNTENSAALREQFNSIQTALQTAENDEQLELAREQLEALEGLAGTEEENRESAKRQEEANELLSKMVSGIDGLADSYDKMLDNLKPSAGLFATLGGLALLFTDPETLFAGVRAAIDGVFAIVDSIKMFLDGDFSEGLALLGDNIGAVAAIIGTVAVLFGGRIIRLVSLMVKGVQGIIKGVTKVGGFIARLGGRFGGLAKIFGRLFLPFTIITGAIGTIQGFIDGFKKGGIIGGIEGGVKGLFNTLVAWPLDLLKDGVAWILGKFGFEDAKATLEAFSFSNLINNLITSVFNMVKGAVKWVGELFTDPVAALDKLSMALIGPDGILGVITAPIDKAINWVMGLFKLGDPSRPFSLYDTLYDPIDKTITWVKGLFTDPVAALQKAWNGLVGEGGLIDIIYSPIDKAIAWIQGLFNWGNPEEPFKLSTVVKDAFKLAKDWIVGLFTWGSEAGSGEDGSWSLSTFIPNAFADVKTWIVDKFTFASDMATEGWTNLKDFALGKFTEAKDWFISKLTFASDMATEGWTNLKDFVSGLWTSVKTWITDKLTWASDLTTEGWTNLKDFVSTKFTEAKDWFIGKLTFASNLATEGWTSLSAFVSGKWNEVHTWITGLFDWASDGLSEGWTNLTDFVSGKWTATKKWFTDMFSWSSNEDDKGVVQQLFDSTIEKITSFFTGLFDFLPSISEIKESLQGMLPSWLQPDSVSDMASELESEGGVTREEVLAATTDEARAALAARADDNSWTYGYNEAMRAIEAIQAAELNRGGIVKAPETGGLAVMHGAEIVAPLDSPQGKVLMAINDLMNAKAATGTGEYGSPSAAAIVMGGNTNKSNTNNVNTTNYTIQQGVTPDDFLKRDFLNFSY